MKSNLFSLLAIFDGGEHPGQIASFIMSGKYIESGQGIINLYMGQSYQDEKYALSFFNILSVFMVTLSQKESSESQTKSTQFTSTLRRVMELPCFYCQLIQFNTVNN